MRDSLHLAITGIAFLIATTLFVEWRSEVRDRARLQATLAVAEQSLQRATTNQQDRDRQLNDAVAKLEALKSTVLTQQQIIARLPEIMALPKPLIATPSAPSTSASDRTSEAATAPGKPTEAPRATGVALPAEDLKPLYDFAVDCKTCQTRLAAATADLADEKTKTQALGRERDAALKLARGGSVRQRIGRAAKWFAIGAIAGAIASKAH